MMKKKKQSRSQSSTKNNLEPSPDSSPSPSPRLLSIFRSKLTSGKDLKHMLIRGMRSKTVPGLSSQSRIVRCPKCQKLLQEPLDATSYKCGGCDSVLHAKRLDQEGNDKSIPLALLSSESAETGSKTPMRNTHREYNSKASPSVERGYHSETVYKNETSDIRREWMRKADNFSDSNVFDSARSSPYNSRSNASEWKTQHEGRYQDPSRVPLYLASPSPSSAYEYGYSSSPFHGSQVSASEQSYYQPNQFKQYGREARFQESYVASPARFQGEPSDGKYYHHWPSQSQLHDLQYQNLYESNISATPHRSVYSERSYQEAAAPHRSVYSERSYQESEAPHRSTYSEPSSEKNSLRSNKKNVRERNHVVKRYVLPSAGGAPFVTCSYCLEVLELPQVSLRGKNKRYQVRCGSCSGVLKFSDGEKPDTVIDSPGFVDSGTGFADETVTIVQDSASEGHGEIYPDDSHLSSSENGSGDRICKISNVSSETIGETSRNHLEQSEEAHSEKSTEMDNNIFERVSCNLEDSGYEKNKTLKPEEMFRNGSDETSEVPLCKNGRTSVSSIEAETVAERLVSHSEEPLNKNDYVCETLVLSENSRDIQEINWEETQENEEHGGESTWEEITGDKPRLHMKISRDINDSICDSIYSNDETFEDKAVKEDTEHISSTLSATLQSPLKSLVNENQMFIGHPEQSGEVTDAISRIYEEQSKHAYENSSDGKEMDKTISDRVRYVLEEESRYDTNETLELDKVGEDGSVVSLEKASETLKTIIDGELGEERSVSHQMDPQFGIVERGYVGERIWAESMGDRAGLHLEEYESNYENYYSKPLEWSAERAPTFHMQEYEQETIIEPEEDADGRSESHESSEENDVFHESQNAKPDQSQYENHSSSERQEFSNTVSDVVRSKLQECRYEKTETLETGKMVEDGSAVSLEKSSETNIGEKGGEMSVSHQMEPQNKHVERSGYANERSTRAETIRDGSGLQLEEHQSNPFEWTSERAPTFRLLEYELGTMLEPDGDANGRSISISTDSFSDHENSKEIAVSHQEEPWLVDDNRTDAFQVGEIVENGPLLQLEKCKNESMKLEETFEWTSVRALTFRLHEYEPGTMLEHEENDDGRSEHSSRSSKERVMNHEAEDGYSLHSEKVNNETVELDDRFRYCPDDTLEQEERMMFHIEMSKDKQENPRQTSASRSEDDESPSKIAKEDSESEEEILEDHFQKENEKAGLTSEPYAHIYTTTEPTEIVGLRHALYQTQSSPLRSPLTSPIHTPIGSPLHYLMASPMHSRIVSPLRSPINSSGSLSDVLFFGKRG